MTNNPVNSERSSAFFEPSPLKLIMLTAMVMLVCIISGGAFIYTLAQSQAKSYTDEQVAILKNQAHITLQPMILAKDSVSMNVYLRTLAQANFINGVTLVDPKRQLLSRAGNNLGEVVNKQIFSQQLAIGELSFFINRTPASDFFNQLLWTFAILAGLTGLFSLMTIGILAKRTMRQFSEQYKPLLEHRFSMELAQVHAQKSAQEGAEQPNKSIPPIDDLAPEEVTTPASAKAEPVELAIVNLDTPASKTNNQQAPDFQKTNPQPPPLQEGAQSQPLAQTPSAPITEAGENTELVSLLKPDSQQRMPHFKPFGNADEEHPTPAPKVESSPSIELVEEDLSHNLKSKDNPLLRPHPHEEQLDLYSLEHQTELNLKAADAAYLLLIDCSSGRAIVEDPDEHNDLLAQYRRLVKLVINIYGGSVELMASGDIRVMFDDADIDDNHGVQALCAAKLFNQLYKYYNHRQITRMLPTLNIQISLVRGNREKLELLREEAHFLTRTTLSNELISHTPLSETEALRDTLLKDSITERQEEDKILIVQLNPSYQELLEKQARHLVKGF